MKFNYKFENKAGMTHYENDMKKYYQEIIEQKDREIKRLKKKLKKLKRKKLKEEKEEKKPKEEKEKKLKEERETLYPYDNSNNLIDKSSYRIKGPFYGNGNSPHFSGFRYYG